VKGLTLSGGEPFMQPAQMAELAKRVHSLGWGVVAFTGYVFEDLLEMAESDPEIAALLAETDILIDGPYVEALRDISLPFRGSANQRVIDVKTSRGEGCTVSWDW